MVFSGRSRSFSDRLTKKRRTSTVKTRDVWFLEKDGMAAMYQRGIWLDQKFHALAQVRELASRFIDPSSRSSITTARLKTRFAPAHSPSSVRSRSSCHAEPLRAPSSSNSTCGFQKVNASDGAKIFATHSIPLRIQTTNIP